MITVEQLNEIMPLIFLSKQLESIKWGEVSDTDKEVIITQAVGYMSGLRYRGRYVEQGQEYPFPRVIDGKVVEINDNVKKAVCCIVYDLLYSSTNSRKELQKQGVKSISTGGVSETYTDEKVEEVSKGYEKFIGRYLFRGVL